MSGGDVIIRIGEPIKDGLLAFLEFLSRGPHPGLPLDTIQDAGVFPDELDDLVRRIRAQDTPNRLVLCRRDVAGIHRLMAEFAWMRQPPQKAGLAPEAFETMKSGFDAVYEQACAR